jgi:signal transduction histidine kinase/HAMP domain-containing protein
MFGIRQKLFAGFFILLLVAISVGLQSIRKFDDLGKAVDVIMEENYRSVIACQDMKEALERMDSGILYALLGEEDQAGYFIEMYQSRFDEALALERANITLPGEQEKVDHIAAGFKGYGEALQHLKKSADPPVNRMRFYFNELFPMFQALKTDIQAVLEINQQHMQHANATAYAKARKAKHDMVVFLLLCIVVSTAFIFFSNRWILHPIRQLIRSADEVARGNLDLVLQQGSRDEIGQLKNAFNEMVQGLRAFRRTDRIQLVRSRRATERVFASLPDAVALLDLEGVVEASTKKAQGFFNLKPGVLLHSLPWRWMSAVFEQVVRTGATTEGVPLQHFIGATESYFRPAAYPVLAEDRQLVGVILVLQDVTQMQQQTEIKRDIISTVSHQLKTPLTSVRMAVHLLLSEKTGPLLEKQVELLLAAREDSERLYGIIEDLLDLSRIESGKATMHMAPIPLVQMVSEAVQAFQTQAKDAGLELQTDIPADLPDVSADTARIAHVLANLLTNAIAYTPPGGSITIAARPDDWLVYCSVSDTGRGIPGEHLDKVFDPFFRVPGEDRPQGAGLGLSIVKEIVESHGGTVCAHNREGGGSRFEFSLRRADSHPAAEAQT